MVRRRELALSFPDESGYPPLSAAVLHRVAFSEVDPMRIMWFGRYATLVEEAAAELRDRCGLSHAAFFAAGIQPPIVRYDVEYLQPSRLDEKLKVIATLHASEAARLNINYRVVGPDGAVRVVARTVQVFWNIADGQPCLVPPPIWTECLQRWRNGEFACLYG